MAPLRGTPPSRRPGDGIYRAILRVMVATVVFGAILAIVGETLVQDPALGRLGLATAGIGAVIYAFFRILGARAARRRQDRSAADPQP